MARRNLAPVPDVPLRVVLYRRVSALMGRGGDDFHSPELQLSSMRRSTVGMREVAVVDDIDTTGRTFSRDGIDQIRAMAEARTFDVLAVYDVSRLGRNVRESLIFLNWLADQGVTIVSACEQVDTSTPAGRLMLTQMLAIAEWRSDEIGAGWSRVITRRAESGHQHRATLGYQIVDKRMTLHPVHAETMTDAFRAYAAGTPIRHIADMVAVARGRPIRTTHLKRMLRNPVYLGHVTLGGEIVAHDAHPPLVDADTWQRVQARLDREVHVPSRHLEIAWSLVGLGWCPDGHRLQRTPHRNRGVLTERVVCGHGGTATNVGGPRCPGIGMPRLDAVEAEVLRQVGDYVRLLRDDHAARAARIAARHTTALDIGRLRRELARVETAIARLAKARALGDLVHEDAEYYRPVAELRAEAKTLAARLAEVGEPASGLSPVEAANAAAAMLRLWPEMTIAERHRTLRDVVVRFEVRRAAYWREPEADRVRVTEWR